MLQQVLTKQQPCCSVIKCNLISIFIFGQKVINKYVLDTLELQFAIGRKIIMWFVWCFNK